MLQEIKSVALLSERPSYIGTMYIKYAIMFGFFLWFIKFFFGFILTFFILIDLFSKFKFGNPTWGKLLVEPTQIKINTALLQRRFLGYLSSTGPFGFPSKIVTNLNCYLATINLFSI